MKGLVNSICSLEERLAIIKFTFCQKDAGLSDDLTEFNSLTVLKVLNFFE